MYHGFGALFRKPGGVLYRSIRDEEWNLGAIIADSHGKHAAGDSERWSRFVGLVDWGMYLT
jgi:hypothetical protein